MNILKKMLKIILRIIIVLVLVIAISGLGVFGAVKYLRWRADNEETVNEQGEIITVPGIKEEEKVTCLFMGVNGALTDFIMLGQYNPNTREIDLLSIPRDTKVNGTLDGKINSAYLGKYPERTIQKVKELTGIEAQYYLVFNAKLLRQIVDEIGGVTVYVPINMNYDDPYQDLYIHLKKGTQTLTGSQAEQFVRFRKNNDGTVGYPNGDIGRVAAQQEFIKATINRVLEPQNLLKVNRLVNIVLDNTKTNITWDVAKNYIDDVATFRTDRITMNTLPGEGRYAENGISYFFHDEKETKIMIDEMFNKKSEKEVEVIANITEEVKDEIADKIKVEVLNAGTTNSIFSAVVDKLNNNGYYVSRVGNQEIPTDGYSKIITYDYRDNTLVEMKELLGISRDEESDKEMAVDYTVILGPKYQLD